MKMNILEYKKENSVPEELKERGHGVAASSWASIFIICICSLWFLGAPSYSSLPKFWPLRHARNQRLHQLINFWEKSYFSQNLQDFENVYPAAPHIEDCDRRSQETKALDSRGDGGTRPVWGSEVGASDEEFEAGGLLFNNSMITRQIFHPPWIEGGDEDNLPLTRSVQRDLWLHQHPKNCSDPQLRFLVTRWESSRGLGLGAQIVAAAGMFAIALSEKRVLVLKDFDRAKHRGCTGESYGRWSCYFAPETSEECKARAAELELDQLAWSQGVITGVKNYSKDEKWTRVPDFWGKPWESMQPYDVVAGQLLGKHKAMDRQWWRAQAVRYLTRFPRKYLCQLLNRARHEAFGRDSAEVALETLPDTWPHEQAQIRFNRSGVEKVLRIASKPWIPRPMLSVHVRQGDKSSEMEIFSFKAYMLLAERLRRRFPQIKGIWLSTEMQTVVEETVNYTNWSFYFTNVTRQNGTTKMGDYERSLGTEQSSNNALVNLVFAVDCDYFVGVLGSTWSLLIDGLRMTGGKLKFGFLSVNKDRYW